MSDEAITDEDKKLQAFYKLMTTFGASLLFCVRHPGANFGSQDAYNRMQECLRDFPDAVELASEVSEYNETCGNNFTGKPTGE